MLTKNERDFLENPKKRQQYPDNVQRQYDYRIRNKTKQMLKELQFLAEHLPEPQQEQVFTKEIITSLIKSLLNPKRADINYRLKKNEKEYRHRLYVTNERMFILCNTLIEEAAQAGYQLLPSDVASMLACGLDYQNQIDAVRKVGLLIK